LDRADRLGPIAELVEPRDNDAEGNDVDPNETYVALASGVLSNFEILLVDPDGTGPDSRSIKSESFTLSENGQTLFEGIDYIFGFNATSNTIRFTPFSGIWRPASVYEIALNNRDQFVINVPAVNSLVDGNQFTIEVPSGANATFEFESGYSIRVPETFSLQIPEKAAGPGGIADGETFSVGDGILFVVFEFDFNGNSSPANTAIPLDPADTLDDIADKIVAAINMATLGFSPRNLGDNSGVVELGSLSNHNLNTTAGSLTQSGQAAGLVDGEFFTVEDSSGLPVGSPPRRVTFEFDTDASVGGNNIAIDLQVPAGDPLPRQTQQSIIAERIKEAIETAMVGLPAANHLGDGLVHLAGTPDQVIDASGANLALLGLPGVANSLAMLVPIEGTSVGGLVDGEVITISDGTNSVSFEIDLDGSTTAGNTAVALGASTQDEVATALVNVISNDATLNLTPTYEGGGVIRLNETVLHLVDVSATQITLDGVAGGAIPIVFLPSSTVFTQTQLQGAIISAINNSGLGSVHATPRGLTTIFVESAADVQNISNFPLAAITDVAGNTLQPNRPPNVTRFTIQTPGTVLDYGDAIDSELAPQYPTLLINNGARHVVLDTPDRLFLGAAIDVEADGNPSANADGDGLDDDGVDTSVGIFTPTFETPLLITSSGVGFVDGWVDFNQNGNWNDPGERILNNVPVVAGENLVLANPTPSGALLGETLARFRLSRIGPTFPTGLVVDGEVEDYQLRIISNVPPTVVGTGIPDVTAGEDMTITSFDITRFFDDLDIYNAINNDVLRYDVVGTNEDLVDATIDEVGMLNLALILDQNEKLHGEPVITVRATDRGGRFVDSSFILKVTAINDEPLIDTAQNTVAAVEDTAIPISGISVSDVDAAEGTGDVQVTLKTDSGGQLTVRTDLAPGLVVLGNDSDEVFLTGTPDEINTTLASAGLIYLGATDFSGVEMLDIELSDLGNYSLLGNVEIADPHVIEITVAGVNDAPTFNVPTGLLTLEDVPLTISGLQILDPDVGAGDMLVQLNVDNGTLTLALANLPDLDITPLGANGTNSMEVRGILNDLNAALDGIVYLGNQDFHGTSTININVSDLGNPALTSSVELPITVTSVNDQPNFMLNQVFVQQDEDAGLQRITEFVEQSSILAGPADEVSQGLDFVLSIEGNVTGNLAFRTIDINAVTGDLTYQTEVDTNGEAVFRVVLRDQGLAGPAPNDNESEFQLFTINVTAINDPPTFDSGPDQTINEDAGPILIANWAENIQPGPSTATDESDQINNDVEPDEAFKFTVVPLSGPNNVSFVTPPQIDKTTGDLTYQTSPDSNGQTVFDVNLIDGENDQFDTSLTHRLTITVAEINDAPDFVIAKQSQTVNEDSAEITVVDFITDIVRGPATAVDEIGQVVEFETVLTSTGNIDFEIAPRLEIDDSDGTADLVFKPLANTNGQTIVTLTLRDSGSGVLPDNINRSPSQTFTITVNAINDAPSFTLLQPDVAPVAELDEDPPGNPFPSFSIPGFASSISAGPLETQSLAFDVRYDGTPASQLTFAELPQIDPTTGDLTFKPTADTSGIATFVVSLSDDGSGSPPNQNTSGDQLFTITVDAVNDAPEAVNPIGNVTVDEDASNTEIELFPSVFEDVDILFQGDELTLTVTSSDESLVLVDLAAPATINNATTSVMLSLDYQSDRNGQAEIRVTATDKAGESDTSTFTVTVNAINDAPTVGGVPAIDVLEDTLTSLDGLIIGDVDAAETNGAIRATFSVNQGTLSLLDSVADGITASDIEANDAPTVIVTATPVAIAATLAATNGLTYLGNLDTNGADNLVITVNDMGASGSGDVGATDATIGLNVIAVNDDPQATDDQRTTAEDTMLSFSAASLRVNDVSGPATAIDETFQQLVVTSVTSSGLGTVTLVDGTIKYTPPADFNTPAEGVDTFTYTVTDNGQPPASTIGTVTVTVTSVNDSPVPREFGQSTQEDVPLVFDALVLLVDVAPGPPDENGQFLTVTAVDPITPNGGTVSLISGAIQYIPPANFVGTDEFEYTITDDGLSDSVSDPREAKGRLTVVVSEVNDPPTANDDDQLEVAEDGVLQIAPNDLLGNDSTGPANESSQTLSLFSTASESANGGIVSLNGVTGFTVYTPPADFNGNDTFTYVVEDTGTTNGIADPKRDVGTVTITVYEVNDAPTATEDFVNATEDTPLQISAAVLTTNDDRGPTNESSQSLAISLVSPQSTNGGTVTISSQVITYIPRANFTGVDTFDYQIIDNGTTNGVLDSQTSAGGGIVTVTVSEVNDPPMPGSDGDLTTREDVELIIEVPGLLLNDSRGAPDEEATQSLIVTQVTPITAGSTVTLLGNLIAFQPPADFNGVATFAYTVEDNGTTDGVLDPRQGQAVVSVSVTPVNDAPIANTDFRSVNEDELLTIVADDTVTGLIANDFGGPLNEQNEPLTVVEVASVSNAGGTITFVDGDIRYLPPANFNGLDRFTYVVQDTAGERATGTVSLTVNALNDPPVAVPDAYATSEDDILTIPGTGLLDNDFDVDIPANTLTVSQPPQLSSMGAVLTINPDGRFDYDPTNAVMLQALQIGQAARDEFVYSIDDGTGTATSGSNAVTVTITVSGRNDAPIGQDDQYGIFEDQTLIVDVVTGLLNNDSDPENDVISALIVSQPANGSVTLQTNGAFTYTPRMNFNGLDTFEYRATDGALSSDIVTVTIDVASDPEAPTAVADNYQVDANTTLSVSSQNGVLANDSDDDGPIEARLVSGPNNGTLTLNSDGSFEYTPDVGFTGTASFSYAAVDGENLVSPSAFVTIQVSSTALWQNALDHRDVNADGSVTPLDALIVINRLNGPDGSVLDPTVTPAPPPFYDVNADGIVSPADVLIVINAINQRSTGEGGSLGEGEASPANFDAFGFLPSDREESVGNYRVLGPRPDATVVNQDGYFDRLGRNFALPLAAGSSYSSAMIDVDAIVTDADDSLHDELDEFFRDDSSLDDLF
jgi:VCBS repeat-containing protein